MSAWRVGLATGAGLGLSAALLALYLQRHDAPDREPDREAPIVAPSRVRVEEGGPVVAIDSGESRRLGLRTAVLAAASEAPPIRLASQVVEEPERVATVRAPLAGLLALPPGARWPAIGDRVAAGTAVAQVSDARPLAPALGGTVSRVGARPGEMVAAGQMLLEVVDRSRPAVRVVWDPAAGEPAGRLVLEPPGGARRLRASLIGPAPEADPLTRRPAYLYRAERGWPGDTPGTPVAALVPSRGQTVAGALVPEAAVVQWEGLTWAYRRHGSAAYQRVAVPTDRPVTGGWLTVRGLSPGDTVVVIGAQELLSEEFRARVSVGDESGE